MAGSWLFSTSVGEGSAHLPALSPQAYLCCTGKPTAPPPGDSTLLWALPAVDPEALAVALSRRNVCPRTGLQGLASAGVLRAGLALTAAWLCVQTTATPTPGQGSVTRYGWGRRGQVGQVGWEWLRAPLSCFRCPQSLGVCICAEGFGGPDCATTLDGGQLVWETLMDSRLSAVSSDSSLSMGPPGPGTLLRPRPDL